MKSPMFLNRRNWLASLAGGAAAHTALSERLSAADNPAANVEDRTSSIRITKLTATPAGRKVFIKLETNLGVTGWGEIDQLDPNVGAMLVRSLFELLDGENPTRIEHLWQKLYRSHRDIRGGSFMVHTIAGIDMALWDIAGKLWGVPVYRLMGGPTRDKVWVYPSVRATKVGSGPLPFSGNPQQVERLVAAIAGGRKQVGPEGIVMFDAHCALPPPMLLQFASAVKAYEITYIEEPAVPGNIEVFKRLKEQIPIPFAVGEQARTIWDVVPYLEAGIADFMQVDCAHTGGMSQLRKIATLAEVYQVPLTPHCVTTDLGMTASLHVSASVPMFFIHEYYPSITPKGLIDKGWEVDKDGYASLPTRPGIGCIINEERLAEVAKMPIVPEWPTRGRYPDGSIADY